MSSVTINEANKTKDGEQKSFDVADIKSFWKFNNKLGIKNLFYGVDYQRCLEYPVAYNELQLDSEVTTLLDIGTGKHSIFPLYVSYRFPELNTRITDLGSYVFKQLDRIKKVKELSLSYHNSRLIIEKQDATQLTYEDNTFDRVSAISAIEHIPDDGDSRSIKEICRVLKPGGRVVVTVPYQDKGYEARYRQKTTYTTEYEGEPVFFSHYYNEKALYERLVEVSGLELDRILYLGEREFPYFDFWCTKVPLRNCIKYVIGWVNPLMALKYYKILEQNEKEKAHVAVVSLIKR